MNSESPPEARIILGGGIDASGKLSDTSMSRVKYALGLYRHQRISFVMSGRWSLLAETEPARTEAAAMREYAMHNGVLEDDIFVEDESMDTIGNAYFSYVQFIKPKGWQEIEVVTSGFHSARAQYAFNKVLGNSCHVRIAIPPDILFSASEQARLEAREQKVLSFIQQLFDPIPDGDISAIHARLQTLPGYSLTPEYSREELLQILDDDTRLGDLYIIE